MHGVSSHRVRAAYDAGCDMQALGGPDSRDSHLRARQIQVFFLEAALCVMDLLVLSDAARERRRR